MPSVTAIYRSDVVGGTGTFELDPPDIDEMAARYARIVAGGYPFLVAEHSGAVAGYAYAHAFRERGAFRFTVEDSVYVDRAHQGVGVGRALLEMLIDVATTRGYRQMVALIGDSANRGSIALHTKAGFAHAGVMRSTGWKADRWLDVVIMQRPLGAGDTRAVST